MVRVRAVGARADALCGSVPLVGATYEEFAQLVERARACGAVGIQRHETLELCDRTSPYCLTGAIFARDRSAIRKASETLVNAAGNFYINDKPTGAVVGLQPFGGARASGTNDKAGSYLNLLRWVSPRTIKETYVPPTDHRYPYMDAE